MDISLAVGASHAVLQVIGRSYHARHGVLTVYCLAGDFSTFAYSNQQSGLEGRRSTTIRETPSHVQKITFNVRQVFKLLWRVAKVQISIG